MSQPTVLRRSRRLLRPTVLGTLAILWFVPVYWVLLASFSGPKALLSGSLVPDHLTFDNYSTLFRSLPMITFIVNSVTATVLTTVISTALAAMAGYALARTRFWGHGLFGRSVLFAYTMPKVLLVIPIFVLLSGFGISNSQFSLGVPYVAFTLPFGIWLMKGFFDGIPRELDDAAAVDGANRVQTFLRVMLPIAAPGLATVAVFAFMFAWNDYFFALVLLTSQDVQTLPIGIVSNLTGPDISLAQQSQLMAASVVSSVPVVVVFGLAQRYFASGLASGSVKG